MKLKVKWYVYVWRLVWFALGQVFRVAFCLTVLCGWGVREAGRAWQDTD